MTAGIEVIVGLGNPGPDYEPSRHNAGFWFLDEIARRHALQFRAESKFAGQVARLQLHGHQCWLLKPTTYMNHSGRAIAALARFYRLSPEQLLVAHDELDLPPGSVRLKQGGGHGGHNGLRDTMAALGSRDFHRLRIGIGHPGQREQVVDYVLSPPSREEESAIRQAIDRAADHLAALLEGRFQQVMNELHR
jgi:PTH1 family peptidyl-tRNA hydrolase